MAAIGVLVFLTAVFAAAIVPRRYTATAELMAGPASANQLSSEAANTVDYRRDLLIHDGPLVRAMLAAALDDGAQGHKASEDPSARERAIRVAFANLAILPGNAGTLIVRFTADSPQTASHTANAVGVKAVQYLRSGEFWTQSQMSDRLEALRADALRARSIFEEAVLAARKSAQASTTSSIASSDPLDLQAAKKAQIAAHAELSTNGIERGVDGVIESTALRTLETQIADATARRDALMLRYGPRHPAMIAAEKDLTELNASHAREAANAGSLFATAQRLDNQERSLQATAASQQTVSETNAAANARRDAFGLTATIASERYRIALERYQAPAAPGSSAPRVIAFGTTSSASGWPNTFAFMIAGLVAAFTAAALTYGVRELKEKGLRSRKDVKRSLDLALVAMVPALKLSDRQGKVVSRELRPLDYMLTNQKSDFNKVLNGIISKMLSREATATSRSIAICSALSGEGKTTLSTCVARAAGLAGLRVVLVDCDGRRRESTRALAPSFSAGVVQILKGEASLDQALVLDAPSGAWIIPHSSDLEIEPAPFSSKRAVRAFLEQLGARFDLVILDTAPVLALADARVLASLAEQVLLVAKWRTTPAAATRAAADLLEQAGANVTGAALTLVECV